MQVETHDLLHEFPEHAGRIAELREDSDAFRHMMDEHNWLDSHIRSLEEHDLPVADFHIEEMKKRRLLLKDRLYALITE